MKREDLHRNRPMRTHTASRHTAASNAAGKSYPFCHFLQFGITLLLLLIILGSQYLFPEKASNQLQDFIKQELNTEITVSTENWNGSLKDIFSYEHQQ